MIKTQKKKVAQTTKITIIGFLILILLGGFLLNLTICNAKGTTFLDSVFTSAASVCVAGLSTVTAGEQYTLVRKNNYARFNSSGSVRFYCIDVISVFTIKKKNYLQRPNGN